MLVLEGTGVRWVSSLSDQGWGSGQGTAAQAGIKSG